MTIGHFIICVDVLFLMLFLRVSATIVCVSYISDSLL